MINILLIGLASIIFICTATAQSFSHTQSFEQGFFETDKEFTYRLTKQYLPELQTVYIEPWGYNNEVGWIQKIKRETDQSEIVKSLNSIKLHFSLKPIHIDGDIVQSIGWLNFNVHLVDVNANEIVYTKNCSYNLLALQNSVISKFTEHGTISNNIEVFLNTNNWSKDQMKAPLKVKIYCNNSLVFESEQYIILSRFLNRPVSIGIIK